jgi:large subunit ribosomal protein L3
MYIGGMQTRHYDVVVVGGGSAGIAAAISAARNGARTALVEAGPCTVTQIKKAEGGDQYEAIQLGFGARPEKRTTKPQQGHFKKAKSEPKRFLREVRLAAGAAGETKVGDTIACTIFAPGEYVDVIGTMKGRGFSGVVRRHGFATQKESHGAHYHWRHAGSIGCRKPEHTRSGTRMGGQYGNTRSTVQNLKIARVDGEKNLLFIRGAIPGANGGMVLVRASKKIRTKPKVA